MVVHRSLKDIQGTEASVLTMGTFDGLHRGHQEIVQRVIHHSNALNLPSVLITYDPHPRYIINKNESPPPMIMSIEKKLQILDEMGLDVAVVIPFTKEISSLSAAEYIDQIICHYFHPKHIIIGYDHHFGHDREGSPESLESYCETGGFTLDVVNPVTDEGNILSSTRIRELISGGFVRRASFELGWVYGFDSEVVHGAGRGKQLSFPTANFIPKDKNQLLPKNGVYCTRGRVHGQQLYGMCNLGIRPTFGEKDFVMEVHFIDESPRDLYGQTITIEFLERIRDEITFESADSLIRQLELDKNQCTTIIKKYM